MRVRGEHLGPPAPAVLPMDLNDPVEANALPTLLGKGHVHIPVLGRIGQLPAADRQQRVAAEQRAERIVVHVRDDPGVELRRRSQPDGAVADAEALDVTPARRQAGVGVQGIGEERQRAGRNQIVAVQGIDVSSGGGVHPRHARHGYARICLMHDMRAAFRETVEQREGGLVRRAVIHHHQFTGLLRPHRRERLRKKPPVVVARYDDRDAIGRTGHHAQCKRP